MCLLVSLAGGKSILHWDNIPGRENFCPGKLTLGKILSGKKSVPGLKNGGKNSVPSGVGKGKKEIRREATNKFLVYIFCL